MSQEGSSSSFDVGRRRLLKTAAVAGATILSTSAATAQDVEIDGKDKTASPAGPPTAEQVRRETEAPPAVEPAKRSGSDYMVDAIVHLDIPYVAAMAGSSFRGLHESLINYGNNTKPEFLTCLHEEISVGLAHGYAKVTQKPLIAMMHGAVGVQHAAMAVYNAWVDRVPMILIGGNTLEGAKRRVGVEWNHSGLDQGATLRDFVKWDAQPVSLADFNEALKRGRQLAMSPPGGPVLLMVDSELQENPIASDLKPERLASSPAKPVGDPAALKEAARRLIAAANPVIVADRLAKSEGAMAMLVTLAELLEAPVVDRYGYLNMPTAHYLCQTSMAASLIAEADVILGLDVADPFGTLNTVLDLPERRLKPLAATEVAFIHISTGEMSVKSNYQDIQRFQPAAMFIPGDAEATLPYLVEAVRSALTTADRSRIMSRRQGHQEAFQEDRVRQEQAAALGWNATPITTARWCSELYNAIKHLDWALLGSSSFISSWPTRLWDFTHSYQYTSGPRAAGVGFGGPASLGAALAHKEHGRLSVNIVGDGDLLCCPSSLWTAAHHRIPMIYVVHNNRAYHQELMHVQRMANRHDRGITRTHIGTTIDNPDINFAKMAESFGVTGIGPVTDPASLAGAFKRAVAIARGGDPVLIEIVSQPR